MSAIGRDRDPAGRPRNARPRDAYGRPLPRGAQGGPPRISDDYAPTPEQALADAQRFLDDGFPFHAHEVLEAAWKSAAEPERELWRGLAQIAVGLTHAQRGNGAGAGALLDRGARRVASYADDPPYDIAAATLVRHARQLADRIDRDGLAAVTDADLRPSLRDAG